MNLIKLNKDTSFFFYCKISLFHCRHNEILGTCYEIFAMDSELFNYSLDFYCDFRKWNDSNLEQFHNTCFDLKNNVFAISTNADKCQIEKQMRYVNNKIHWLQIRLVFSRVSSVHLFYSISRTIDAAGRKAYDVPHYSL